MKVNLIISSILGTTEKEGEKTRKLKRNKDP
jgi:hypothetical protein